ncbi:hypothetical protein [Streptomyces sp. NPDC056982]|uniref:hypothetical protein n=1 Tax=Streptomyces sp. NPDC056982 TaxID=3345986 RepID=UPI00363C5E48
MALRRPRPRLRGRLDRRVRPRHHRLHPKSYVESSITSSSLHNQLDGKNKVEFVKSMRNFIEKAEGLLEKTLTKLVSA